VASQNTVNFRYNDLKLTVTPQCKAALDKVQSGLILASLVEAFFYDVKKMKSDNPTISDDQAVLNVVESRLDNPREVATTGTFDQFVLRNAGTTWGAILIPRSIVTKAALSQGARGVALVKDAAEQALLKACKEQMSPTTTGRGL
jgi:hypothetical protein